MAMIEERGAVDVTVDVVIHMILGLVALMCLVPFVHLAAVSLSATTPVATNQVWLWPVGFNVDNYLYIFRSDRTFLGCMLTSVERVLVGVSVGLLISIITAYPLSRDNIQMPGRVAIKTLIIFGMMFNAGFIPYFLSLRNLGLLDKFAVLILPGAFNVFNTILIMNYFRGLPNEIYESAVLDGASHLQVLFRVFLPVSQPVLATVTLFSTVSHWNSWFDGFVFLRHVDQWPLQSYLYGRVILKQIEQMAAREAAHGTVSAGLSEISPEALSNAMVFVTMVPIMLVYPFLQRYFVTGLTLGAVKE